MAPRRDGIQPDDGILPELGSNACYAILFELGRREPFVYPTTKEGVAHRLVTLAIAIKGHEKQAPLFTANVSSSLS
jgi:hypothetical protein